MRGQGTAFANKKHVTGLNVETQKRHEPPRSPFECGEGGRHAMLHYAHFLKIERRWTAVASTPAAFKVGPQRFLSFEALSANHIKKLFVAARFSE